MTERLIKDPRILPPSLYTKARHAASHSITPLGNLNYEAIYALADVVIEALAGLGMTKYVFIHRVDMLPAWSQNFPAFDPARPTLEDASAVALTIARECPTILIDGGHLACVASHQAARAIVISLYAEGILLASFSDPFDDLPLSVAEVRQQRVPDVFPNAPMSLTEKIFGIRGV